MLLQGQVLSSLSTFQLLISSLEGVLPEHVMILNASSLTLRISVVEFSIDVLSEGQLAFLEDITSIFFDDLNFSSISADHCVPCSSSIILAANVHCDTPCDSSLAEAQTESRYVMQHTQYLYDLACYNSGNRCFCLVVPVLTP